MSAYALRWGMICAGIDSVLGCGKKDRPGAEGMKRKILYTAVLMICLSILSSGSFAYFTTEGTTRNVITSGGIGVRVVEQQLVDGIPTASTGQSIRIVPDITVSKIVSAKSTEQSAWIRMNYSAAVYDSDGRKIEIPAEELASVIVIEPDTEYWMLVNDWWYYHTAVKAGETTQPLFETVTFSGPDMGNEYQNCTVKLYIFAQAVQQANNGASVMEAKGWP